MFPTDDPHTTNDLFINGQLTIPSADLAWSYVRSSGPGGQNVNKVSSKAVLRWRLSTSPLDDDSKMRFATLFPNALSGVAKDEVVLSSDRFRDAPKNKEECCRKLRNMILKALVIRKVRIPTKPTRGSQRRRLASKAIQSAKKQSRRPVRFDD